MINLRRAVVPDRERTRRGPKGIRPTQNFRSNLLRRKKLPGSVMDNPEDVARVREIKRLLDRIQQLPLVPEVPDQAAVLRPGSNTYQQHGPAMRTDRLRSRGAGGGRRSSSSQPLAFCAGDGAQYHRCRGARRSHHTGRRAPRVAARRNAAQGPVTVGPRLAISLQLRPLRRVTLPSSWLSHAP